MIMANERAYAVILTHAAKVDALRYLDIRVRYFRLIEQQEEWEIELLSI